MNLRPQPLVDRKLNNIIALITFAISLTVYILTLARSLSFWDAGEYITCSSILGVPHPPGNPFYIILGKFFTSFGFGLPHAQVINLLSGIFSAFAVMFTYLITVKLVTMMLTTKKDAFMAYIAGFAAAMYTAFSYTFWNNAIEAEVYSGLAFIINIIFWLTLVWAEKSRELSHQNILLLIIYIFFLGFGIHQTSLQVAPAVLFVVIYPYLKDLYKTSTFWVRTALYLGGLIMVYLIFNVIGKNAEIPDLSKYMFSAIAIGILVFHMRDKIDKRAWWMALFLVLIGLSTHIFLGIRAAQRPFINEGHPSTISAFTDYILRRQYGTTSMFVRRATFWHQIKVHFLDYFSVQFFNVETIMGWIKVPGNLIRIIGNMIVALLGFGGAMYQYKRNKHSFAYFVSFMFMASIAMIFVMNLSDAEVRERDYFFTTAYNFWTIWMGIGAIGLVDFLRKKSKVLLYLGIAIALILPGLNLASQYFIHDRSKEYIALDYGMNILNSVEKDAIIFTNGDNDTFPVWYAQAVNDPAAHEYIPPSIHTRQKDIDGDLYVAQTQPTAKTVKLIEDAMEYKNEECFGIRKDVTIANLSLLNTPWYIKQLRDKEGIEFNIPEKHIDMCQDSRQSVLYPRQLPKDTSIRIKGTSPEDSFTVTFKAGTILYVKDLAVIQIIKDNYGKRPIYFAVTTPDVVGFDDHLRNEGMVDRLVATTGKYQVDLERMTTNIDSVYSYRSIFDESVYKDDNMRRLLNNYGAAFYKASNFYHSSRDMKNAIKYMERALEFMEDKERFYGSLSRLYVDTGYMLIDEDKIEEGFKSLENAIFYDRRNQGLVRSIFNAATFANVPDKGIELLKKLRPYQDSEMVDQYIAELSKGKQE